MKKTINDNRYCPIVSKAVVKTCFFPPLFLFQLFVDTPVYLSIHPAKGHLSIHPVFTFPFFLYHFLFPFILPFPQCINFCNKLDAMEPPSRKQRRQFQALICICQLIKADHVAFLLRSTFSDIKLIAWWGEYSHHGNWQTLCIRVFVVGKGPHC